MTRPSRNTDRKLIEAALVLLPKTGFSGLTVRAVAAKAGVNLGMFHYHFGSKAAFSRHVMQALYENFFGDFTLAASKAGTPRERFRETLILLARFIRDHRRILLAVARDVLAGNAVVVRFVQDNFHRHVLIMMKLLRDAQRSGDIRRGSLPTLLPFVMAALAGPTVVFTAVEGIRLEKRYEMLRAAVKPFILNDRLLVERVDMALQALAPNNPQAARGEGRRRKR